MLPRDHHIRNLALYAPRMAYGLVAGVPRVPFIGDIEAQFTSSAVGAPPVVDSLDNNLTQDTIIERISFSLGQQNSFNGSPLQPFFQGQLKLCTGVGVQVIVYGGPKYTLNDEFTPLENLADVLAVTWPNGWPLAKQSNVKMSFVLTQTPQSVPYDVNVTILGWQFLDKCMDDMSDEEARCRLNKLGIETPDLKTLLK
ncbi:MAG TPA: hypothetical protein VMI75_34495 [Polyangiaceae bacterium]|nr:hypothetical protein [Polyangiaceae bacterium]